MVFDREIIALLEQDGRMPVRLIAKALGISEPTAAARIRALESSGAVRVVLKRRALQGHDAGAVFKVEIFVDDPAKLAAVSTSLLDMPGLISAYRTAGRPEIMVTCTVPHIRDASAYFDALATSLKGASLINVLLIIKARHQRPWLHELRMPERVGRDDPDPLRAALRRDARQPASMIARRLGMPEPTARERIRQILKQDGNRIGVMHGADAAGHAIWADLQLTVEAVYVPAVFESLECSDDVILVAQVCGEQNISIFLAAASVQDLDEFVNQNVRTLPGLRSFKILRVTDVISSDYSVDLCTGWT